MDEDVFMMADSADSFIINASKISPSPCCMILQGSEAHSSGPGRAADAKFVGRSCSFQSLISAKLQPTQDPLRSVTPLILSNMHLFDYDSQGRNKTRKYKVVLQQRCLNTYIRWSLVPGNEGTKTVGDVISDTKEVGKLQPRRWKDDSKTPG